MILGAALLAAGAATSMAQSNVYSLNVVGYINIPVATGYTLIANNLDYDGTGTNNLMTNVVSGLVANNVTFSVYKYDTNYASFDIWQWNKVSATWSDQTPGQGPDYSVATLNPGEGAFIFIGKASYTSNFTVVGNVLQGTYTNKGLPGNNNYAMIAPSFPLSGPIDASGTNGTLAFPDVTTYSVYFWDAAINGYDVWQWNKVSGTWSLQGGNTNNNTNVGGTGQGPVVSVGQGFFITTKNTGWTNSFTVQ
jgi:hypothetical protein